MRREGVARVLAPDTKVTQFLLIVVQMLTLVALGLGLAFVVHTTGATLFAFSAVAPLLVAVSVLTLAGVALHRFRKSHSLFEFKLYSRGQVIVREGEPGDCAYFIRRGQVEVVHEVDGGEVVVACLGEGQFFGEMALLSDQPRNATVRAASTTELALLGKRNFLSMLSIVPSTGRDILDTVQRRAMASRPPGATAR